MPNRCGRISTAVYDIYLRACQVVIEAARALAMAPQRDARFFTRR